MRLALPVLVLALAPGCSGAGSDEVVNDGIWTAVTISGEAVPPGDFLLRVRGGRVTGGRDGCNSWGFDETRPPAPDGTRMIIADAQECAPTPVMRAYWRALGNGNAMPRPTKSGNLQLKAGGEEIIARRAPQ